MAAPTPEAIENARRKVEQAKARLQALEARAATLNRKQDARRKIILGGMRLDAAMKDPAGESRLNDQNGRASCREKGARRGELGCSSMLKKKQTDENITQKKHKNL